MEAIPAAPGLRVTTAGREIVLDGTDEKTVGRGSAVDIEIDDELVSRHHAVLRREPGGWVLEDDRSRNGTFHDGRRVHRVRVAGRLVVHLGDPARGPALELAPLMEDGMEVRTVAKTGERSILESPPREEGLGRPTGVHRALQRLTIGRAEDNDVVLSDMLVSRRHAELRPSADGSFQLVDLGSDNGTFVNGRRIQHAELESLDVIGIGRHSFRLVDGLLMVYEDTGDVTFQAADLTVRGAHGEVMLEDVSFTPAGAVVPGRRRPVRCRQVDAAERARPASGPPASGTVLYDGRDLYEEYDELRDAHRVRAAGRTSCTTTLTVQRGARVRRASFASRRTCCGDERARGSTR